MNERKTIETIGRHVRVAFMLTVTATMLALTLEHARRGLPALPTVAVYALTVGFGLEFLRAEWSGARPGRVPANRR
jgi:hypothetical protein